MAKKKNKKTKKNGEPSVSFKVLELLHNVKLGTFSLIEHTEAVASLYIRQMFAVNNSGVCGF